MHRKQLRAITTNPVGHMRFQCTGEMPRMVAPKGPLIAVLQKLTPRERMAITGLRVDGDLGYTGSRIFHTAEAALRWCAPDSKMLENESWPAESWRNKRFTANLSISDVLAKASNAPDWLRKLHAPS
jgi:hypothetical protein